ncbi:MAG: ribonuclease P protein component 1 [Candidatus Aenigmarchaeota archaeon ex4484_52]|nr:MAG: ribonuclease P protein component 1 [Candidatus Aenigmarchaeota archaeon ex4484_52]
MTIEQILEKFPKQELFGLKVKITNSTNKSQIGKSGIIINETKKMLKIRQNDNKEILIEKKSSIFDFCVEKERLSAYLPLAKFDIENNLKKKMHLIIDGKLLVGRSEERIKKKI